MSLLNIFTKPEELIAVDIGTSAVKIAEISASGVLNSFAYQAITSDILSGNLINKPEQLAEIIEKICETHDFFDKRVVFSIPAPAVFTKRIKMPQQSSDDLRQSVHFEAANFIPHKIDAVKLDYAILGESSKNQLDLLVVAVKTELLENYESCLAMAGLESALADIDFFALHNLLQFNYELAADQAVVLINFGYRYSTLTISKGGTPVFVGDISIGVKNLEEELVLKLSLPETEIKADLQALNFKEEWSPHLNAFLDQTAQELNRQISFFWSTCGLDGEISTLFLTGGGSYIPGLQAAMERKCPMQVKMLEALNKLKIGESIDSAYFQKHARLMSVALGLGLRGSLI